MKKFYASLSGIVLFLILSLNADHTFAQKLSAGGYFSLTKCGPCDNVFSWGANWEGELGDSTFNDRYKAGVVHNLNDVKDIEGGGYHSLALKNDSTVWAWGANWDGYIGDGTYIDRLEPVKTLNLDSVIAIAAGEYHSMALKSDGTVWAWGYNGYGELGDSTYTSRTIPVKVKGLSGVIAISAGSYFSMALKSDGTVWTWGNNSNGQLGDSTTVNRLYAVKVKNLTGVSKISAGYRFALALKNDGTLWAWGYNGDGAIGDGTFIQRIYRTQVSVLGNTVIDVDAGWYHVIALKNDNTVWAWGANWYGNLGDNTYNDAGSPIQTLGGMTSVTKISAGGYHSLAMKSDGSVWGWGYNYEGQLGAGDNNNEHLLPVRTLNMCPIQALDIDIDLPASCTKYDTVPAGGNNTRSFLIHNYGCDTLLISNVTSSTAQFTVNSFPAYIAPLDSSLLAINFAPSAPGSYSATITVFNNDADTAFCLQGVSVPPPVISTIPSSFNFSLSCGASITDTLLILNTGNSNLYSQIYGQEFLDSTSQINILNSDETIDHIFTGIQSFSDTITITITLNGDYNSGSEYTELYVDGTYLGIVPDTTSSYTDVTRVYGFSGAQVINWLSDGNITVRLDNSSSVGSGGYQIVNLSFSSGLPYWLTLAPKKDTVAPTDTSFAVFTINTTGIIAGTYPDTLFVASNDPANPILAVPLTLNVVGFPDAQFTLMDIVPTSCLDLDSIMAFTTSNEIIEITNNGCDTLFLDSLKTTPAIFTVGSYPSFLLPDSSGNVQINFTPVAAGSFTGTLDFYSNDADTAICLKGKAFPAPIIGVSPASYTVTLACSDTLRDTLTISNTGGSNLYFNASSNTTPVPTCTVTTTGYCCNMGIYNVTFNTINNNSSNGSVGYQNFTGLSTTLKAGSSYSVSVRTGTSYNEYVRIWIDYNNNGIFEGGELAFGDLNVLPNQYHTGIINIPLSATQNTALRMRVVSDYSGSPIPSPCSNVDYGQHEDYTVFIQNWLAIGPPNTGTVTPTGSVKVPLEFKSTGLTIGQYTYSISISSNDPVNNPVLVPCTLNVIGAAQASYFLLDSIGSCLNLDSIMTYTSSQDTIAIANNGCDTLFIDSLKFSPSVFSAAYAASYILPGDTDGVIVQFSPIASGTITGTVTIYTNDTDPVICLEGEAFPRPIQTHAPASYSITLGCNDSIVDTLTVYNTGGSDLILQYAGGGQQKIKVALVAGEGNASYRTDVQTKLMNTGKFTVVDIFSANSMTPSLAQLQNYDAVLVWSNSGFSNSTLIGDNLADYIDGGGGVVTCVFSNASVPIAGRFNTDNYWCINPSGQTSGIQSLGTIFQPGHPILKDVSTFNGGSSSYRQSTFAINPQATRIADWTDGRALVATRKINGKYRADLGMFPPSGDVIGGGWISSTDGAMLMANALHYSAYGGVDWMTISMEADTLSPPTPLDSSVVSLTFNSTSLIVGTYTTSVIINCNDPLNNPDTIPVTLTVVGSPQANYFHFDSTGNCLDLDSIMEYTTSTDTIGIYNTGCDTLFIDSLKFSNAAFSAVYTANFILPGDTNGVIVQFAPVSTGTITGTITIYTNDTDPVLCLYGEAFARPIISFLPDTFHITLSCNDTLNDSLFIFNNGGSDLNWTLNTGSTLTDDFDPIINPSIWSFHNGIANTNCGSVSGNALWMSDNGNRIAATVDMNTSGGGTISFHLKIAGTGSSCESADGGEDVVLEYSNNSGGNWFNIATYFTGGYPNFTPLSPSIPPAAQTASTRFRWRQLNHSGSCCDHWALDNVTISTTTNCSGNVCINPAAGVTSPSGSDTAYIQFVSTGLYPGQYNYPIYIFSNDPLNNPDTVPAIITVVGAADFQFVGLSDTITPSCLDLDSIMESTTSVDTVIFANTGCDTLFIDSLKLSPAAFTVINYSPYILPGDTGGFVVQFLPASTGTITGTANVYTNDLDTVICLYGESFAKPVQCHNPNSFYEHFLVCQDSIIDTLEICNSGAGNMNYSLWSPYGRSLKLDGTGDYVNRATTTLPTGSVMTVEAWIKPISYPDGTYNGIVSFGGRFCSGNAMVLSIQSNGRPSMATWCWDFVPGTGAAAVLGQWNHIACVLNGNAVTLYMNGVPVSGTLGGVPSVDPNNLAIGSTDYPGRYFNGNIDEVRVYNKALTQADILSTMRNSLNGNEPGLMGYWNFDDSTATDLTSNTNDGTLNGNAFITVPNVEFLPAATGTVSPSGTYSVQAVFRKAGLAPGTHNFPIYLNSNDPLNAVDTIAVTFDIDALPPSPVAGSNSPVCAGNDLSLTSSTISGATYAWTGPNSFTSNAQNPVITGVTTAGSGTYSVVATVSGCPAGAPGTTTVVVNTPPSTPTAGSPGTICSGTNLSLTANTISGATYAWSGPNGFSSSSQNPIITNASTAASGTYSVTASVPGCAPTAAGTTTVLVYQTPVAPTASSNSPVCAGNDLSLTANTISGVTYSWTGPNSFTDATQNPVISAITTAGSGNYTVTATENGCTGPKGITSVVVNPAPGAPSAGSNSTVCTGFTLSLTASTVASGTYAWSGPNSYTAAIQNPTLASVTTAAAGTYSVTVTVPGCPTSPAGTVNVAVNETPVAPTAGSNSPVCVGNDISLTASTIAGVSYAWTGPNSFTSSTQNPVITSATTAGTGTYSVSATIGGCTGPKGTTTVTVNPPPSAPVAGSNSTVCSGQILSLTASSISGATYAWTGPNSYTASVQNPTIAGVATSDAGTYSVTATVPGCPTGPAGTVTVSVTQSPAAPSANYSSPVCSGQTLSLTASTISGATYAWTGPNSFSSSAQDPTIASVTTAGNGTYSVTATVNGCPSAAGTVSVTIFQTPSAPSAGSNSPVCTGFTLSLTANTISGATYAWTGPNSYSDASEDPVIAGVTSSNAGTYSVSVTVNGCSGPAGTTTVVINNSPSSPGAGSNTPVCSGQTLSLTATTVTGASYSWTGPNSFTSSSQNPTIAGVTTAGSGTYSVTATTGGCPPSAPGTVSVTIYQTPSAPSAGSNTPVCVGTALSLTANTISGATYAWTGPNSFTDASEDPVIGSAATTNAGTYSVSVTVNGCTGPVGTTSVVINLPPAVPTAGNNSTICSGQTLSLTASTVSGATYSWTGPNGFSSSSQNPTITGASTAESGTYSVTATISGCPPSAAGTTTATINQTPAAPTASSNSAVCEGSTLSLTASSAGTSYSWSGPAGFTSGVQDPVIASVTTAHAGTYSVTATTLGCTGPAGTTSVVVNTIPAAPTAADQNACFGGTIPDLSATGSNIQWYDNVPALVFSGSPFATGQTAAGSYTYTATQTVNGCTSPSATVILTINALPAAPNAGADVSICYGTATPTFTATGSNITWYNSAGSPVGTGNSYVPGVTAPGSYTFTATQTNTVTTCESLGDDVILTINSIAPPVAPDVAVCAGNPVPPLTATGTNIQWYDAGMSPVFSGSPFATGQTAVGTYTYYVSQTNTVTTCSSPVDTVYLTISTQPTVAPVAQDQNACFGTTIPNLVATTGSIINWYSDAGLANLAFSGNPFATGLTAPGSYTFFATDSTPGCPEGPAEAVVLLINSLPASLSVNDTAICFGSPTPDLITSGTNIQWYDAALTVVSVNDTFATGQTAVGTYTYYVTQTNSSTGCESLKDTVHLTINALPAKPAALDTAVCSAAMIPNLTSSGTNVQWYTMSGTLVFTGNSFATGNTAAGTYSYLVTQKDPATGCESVADTSVLVILLSPPVPVANNVAVCSGNPIPALTTTGINPKWYSDAALTTLVNTGNTFNTGQTAVGVYTYYVTDSLTGCVSSSADSVSLIINATPAKPTAADVTLCYGTVATLTVTGTNPHWHSDATLINVVGTGNAFNTGITAVGTYTYYVTDFAAGCGNSASDTVVLVINPTPLVTANTYTTTIVQGNSTQLTAYNAVSYTWSPSAGLSAATGQSVLASPSVTTTYTVTGTNAYGCSNSVSILIIVNPLGVASVNVPVQDVNIYPNPAIGFFTLEFNTTLETPIDIFMVNMLGDKVRVMQSNSSQGGGLMKHTYRIDTSTLTEGVYNVEIATSLGTVNRRVVLFR